MYDNYDPVTLINFGFLAFSIATSYGAAFTKNWFHGEVLNAFKKISFTYGLLEVCNDETGKCIKYEDVHYDTYDLESTFYILIIAASVNALAFLITFGKTKKQRNQPNRTPFLVLGTSATCFTAFAFGMHAYLAYRFVGWSNKTQYNPVTGDYIDIETTVGYAVGWVAVVLSLLSASSNAAEMKVWKKSRESMTGNPTERTPINGSSNSRKGKNMPQTV